jgi:hypothetical protein
VSAFQTAFISVLPLRVAHITPKAIIRWCIQKSPDWPPEARTANGTALCLQVQFYRYFVSQSVVIFAAINLCVASQRVFIVVVYFVIDSVRKLLDSSS